MKRPLQASKIKLLKSTEVLTKDNVAAILGITPRSASNLLQRWANECAVVRTAPGEYVSAFVQNDREALVLQSLRKRLGQNIIIVGASAWQRVGWCEDSPKLHIAVPIRPSRPLPRMLNTEIHALGAKRWAQLAGLSIQMDLHKPPILHPLAQMVWWMDFTGSPVEMPSPDRVNWAAIRAEPEVAEAMLQKWPDELTGPAHALDVELLYRMLHMDRLMGRTAGKAEPLDQVEETIDAERY